MEDLLIAAANSVGAVALIEFVRARIPEFLDSIKW